MADNYIGNRMDDYLAGRLKTTHPRRLTPSGKRPGTLDLPVETGATVWIAAGALSDAGRRLIELLVNSGLRVSYRAESGKAGAEPAVRFGARHYPPTVATPEAQMTVAVTPTEISVDSGRVTVTFSDNPEAAAALAAAFLTDPGRRASRARIEL